MQDELTATKVELAKQTGLHRDATAALEGMREEVRLLDSENQALRNAMAPLSSLQGDVRELSAQVATMKQDKAAGKLVRKELEDTLTLARLSIKVCSTHVSIVAL